MPLLLNQMGLWQHAGQRVELSKYGEIEVWATACSGVRKGLLFLLAVSLNVTGSLLSSLFFMFTLNDQEGAND